MGRVHNDVALGSRKNFFIFNTFCKLNLNLTLFYFFLKTNIFARAYFTGVVKRLCRAMHGSAAGG